MEDINYLSEKRRYPRIEWSFIIKFRRKDSKDSGWRTSTIKNIGEGGCSFYCDNIYKVGEILEIEIRDPVFEDTMKFLGKVIRSESYGIVVNFIDMDEENRREYIDTIIFLLKREQ